MAGTTVQRTNDDQVNLLTAHFQNRYEPNFSFAEAVGMLQMFPQVRGIWPLSTGVGGGASDISGQSRALTGHGGVLFSASSDGLIPYVDFDGSTAYLDRADEAALDIVGTETYVATAIKGLTIGCWVWTDAAAGGGGSGIIGKDSTAAQRSYGIILNAGVTTPGGRITNDGSTLVSVTGGANVGTSTWAFVCLRFDPSTELKFWVNATTSTNLVGIPASIFSGTSNLELGRYQGGNYLNGRISLAFLCAAALPDVFIDTFYQQSRALFGV